MLGRAARRGELKSPSMISSFRIAYLEAAAGAECRGDGGEISVERGRGDVRLSSVRLFAVALSCALVDARSAAGEHA